MKSLVQERQLAIKLRRKGFSYKEIIQQVPVAKSSLSLWLKDLSLTENEKKYLKERRTANITRGRIRAATAHHKNKLQREHELFKIAKQEFDMFIAEPLFHTGISLYWAEGAKRNSTFMFTNSDSEMIHVMLLWLERYAKYPRTAHGYRLYIHKPYAHEGCEEFWSEELGVSLVQFRKTIYKPTGKLVKKRPNYKGCLRIEVPCSTSLLLKMKFWINMLVEHYRKQ
jgi:hypothetical protein